ncbi:MAG: HAD-IC family P-type ATPase [Pseudomonadota bacterium]
MTFQPTKASLATAAADADTAMGLTSAAAAAALETHGLNRLPEPRLPGPIEIFTRQFLSPFIYILIVAAAVSFLVGQTTSAIFIAAVLVLNALIGAIQEVSAQKSAAALRGMVRGKAHVVRDGAVRAIDIEEVVPGDVALLASGDRVPADITLLETENLTIDESMLTGESLAVVKDAGATIAENAPLGDRLDQCFAGSIVTRGRGRGLVTATGLSTEIGDIAKRVTDKRVSEPPLMIRIRRFTYQMAGAIGVAILGLILSMLWVGGYQTTAMVMMAIGLAVSTIPEGLPAALTVALAIGMGRMARENVIIRKLVAVEALGSCTFICSDKTGTLTVNELTIDAMHLPSGRSFSATGAGVAPGELKEAPGPEDLDALSELVVTGVLANESHLEYAGGVWAADGDIVDAAFLVYAKKFGLSLATVRAERERRKLIPYESENAYSGSVNACDGANILFVKGSPEKILAASTHMRIGASDEPIDAKRIEAQFTALAEAGYRLIALARRAAGESEASQEDPLHDLTFLGMAAMIDPIRPEAKEAIEKCKAGGVGVAMVTGDHPATARAIGADLGLNERNDPVVTGAMIREASAEGPEALRSLILPARVFARIEPAQKETIVETFMADGHFVAVTGDGVNDAPAMRRANVGVAMGKTGTDVAREAADLIITDDNFASIVAGIEQGRIVYNNIRKVIGLLTATGFSAILLFFLSVFAGLPMPLTAVQLLWLNLVANGLQDVALAFEPKEGGELESPPRHPNEPVFERHVVEHVLVAGSVMGVLAFTTYQATLASGAAIEEARNITLMLMVLFGNIHALSSRSERKSLFTLPAFSNRFLAFAVPGALIIHLLAQNTPGLRAVLEFRPVPVSTFATLACVALVFLATEEVHKAVIRRRHRREMRALHEKAAQ